MSEVHYILETIKNTEILLLKNSCARHPIVDVLRVQGESIEGKLQGQGVHCMSLRTNETIEVELKSRWFYVRLVQESYSLF